MVNFMFVWQVVLQVAQLQAACDPVASHTLATPRVVLLLHVCRVSAAVPLQRSCMLIRQSFQVLVLSS
jgi:hypothetical protein